MSETGSARAMADVDKVAEAICNTHDYRDHWHQLADAERGEYRRMALAVIDALGLSEEWRTTGWLGPVDETLARKQAETRGTLQRRLVGQWTPAG